MARLQPAKGRKNRKWRAAVKLNGTEFYLGSFDNKVDAEQAERDFKKGN